MRKTILIFLFAITTLLVFADDKGTNGCLTWLYTESTHTLTFSGEGPMNSFNEQIKAPWYKYSSSVQKIVIEPGVTTIGNRAFLFFEKLQAVDIANTVTTIGKQSFSNCSNIISLKIPNSVTKIDDNAFSKCENLENIELSTGLTLIGAGAFSRCSKLKNIYIPSSVTSISASAFSYCSSLDTIVVDENNPNYNSRENCNAIIHTESNTLLVGSNNTTYIPEGVTTINSSAFQDRTKIKTIYIPNSVTIILRSAFSGCSSLTTVTIPEGNLYISESTFAGCTSLESVVIPSSVSIIYSNAFHGCKNLSRVYISDLSAWCQISYTNYLTSGTTPLYYAQHLYLNGEEIKDLVIPNDVTSISNYAFGNYKGLTSITFHDNITSIGDDAFTGCTNLTSLTIPNSITTIGMRAFSGCTGVKSIIIGSGIKLIKSAAFTNCSALEDVYCFAEDVPETSIAAFDNSNTDTATLHIPSVSINFYNSKEPWRYFKTITPLTDNDPTPSGICRLYKKNQNESLFNVVGQKANKTHQGIYILRGKKIIIK